ncbi:MAG: hypothetical protein ACREEB_00235 [Caulobacteraceae bacterium]
MTCIPIDMEVGRGGPFPRIRDGLVDRRRRLARTLRQARLVAVVFALGAAFHVMKWAGLLVL